MRIQKREHGKRAQKCIAKGILTAACMAVMVWCTPIVSLADAAGKVIPNSVNIRKSPDANSEVVGSSTIGKTVTIKGKVSASGATWYQVYLSANNVGYIRSDMIELEDGAEVPVVSDTSSAAQPDNGGEAQADTPSGSASVAADESVDLQYAKIKVNCKVRPEPSTKKNPVGALTEGAQVIISGKSAGSDGKTWYYVTYTSSNGSENTGFVREDLLEMGEMLPVEEEPPQEETPVEEPEPEPVVNNDYELRLEQREEGPVWYLYDNINGDMRELEPLLQSAYSRSQAEEEAAASVVKQRIVIVVLAVLLAALLVTVIIMALKLRDAYYEDYEDDEDEDDEEEEEDRPARRRMRNEESAGESPVRRREAAEIPERRRGSERNERPERAERRSVRERSYEEDAAQERTAKAAPKRKPKNFLLDDDEFEFEFLNMDDKDLM